MALEQIVIARLGAPSLSALAQCVKDAQADNPFARVVVMVDHHGVAGAVRHWLGAQGTINVTVQTGERLAAELARPLLGSDEDDASQSLRPLTPLDESQAVRRVVDRWLDTVALQLSPAGRQRLYSEVATAFQERERRSDADGAGPEPGTVSFDLPRLYDDFRELLDQEGFYTRYEIPRMAAEALAERRPHSDELSVIYYLPRHPEAGELRLMQALLSRDRCWVIIGLSGDAEADRPAEDLLDRLGNELGNTGDVNPLEQAVAASSVSVVVVPDPSEEVRTVVRRIAAMADATPFHRVAVVHRLETPYASLVRQELDFAGIPFSGIPRRTLADTPAGRLLLGTLGLAAGLSDGIDREALLDLVGSTPVRFPPTSSGSGRQWQQTALVPATHWTNLTREARANGPLKQWKERLDAYALRQALRRWERSGESAAADAGDVNGNEPDVRRLDIDALVSFLAGLGSRLSLLHSPSTTWDSAADTLRALVRDYLGTNEGEEDDYDRILRLVDELGSLSTWNDAYNLDVLRDAVGNGLRSPVSDRGNPVGSGVYVGPPSGIVGAKYRMVFAVGMVEGQFPPPPRVSAVSEWLDDGERARIQRALERYEFLGVLAAADEVVLSYPAAGADRRAAYPSRWLLETANLLHHAASPGGARLASDNLAADADSKSWLTVVKSREEGLRRLASSLASGNEAVPADASDYNLAHMLLHPRHQLASHPAIGKLDRLVQALAARQARLGPTLTRWDGLVEDGHPRVVAIGTPDRPVSASALETWATCPYRFFLGRVLGLYGQPARDDEEMSSLDRGTLVHRILERFVNEGKITEDELLQLAEEEFAATEAAGLTGYRLLWEMEKESIRAALSVFFAADGKWLGGAPDESRAEMTFDAVDMDVEGLGTVRFRGMIDRLDVLGNEVRVRDFKTGWLVPYASGPTTQTAYTVANGRALQLPVYVAAARLRYPEADIRASYCFPLSDDPAQEHRPYTESEGLDQFHISLRRILGMARAGTFPATPDGDDEYSSCRFCDFNRLCPTRRRQIWERKGRLDPAVRCFNALGGQAAIAGNDDAN